MGQQLALVAVRVQRNEKDKACNHMGNWAVPWHRAGAVVPAHVRVNVVPW
jgi:hypothetical protein